MGGDLLGAVNENYWSAFRNLAVSQPGGAIQRFGSMKVASAGFPMPIYNQAFMFEPAAQQAVGEAVEWLRDREVPFWVTPTDEARPTVEAVASELNLEVAGQNPGMVRRTLPDIPNPETRAQISEVVDESDVDDFVGVAANVFGTPEDLAKQTYRSGWEADEIRPFLARIDGTAVGCGMLFETGAVAGIYTMAVVESARRQGIGKAVACELLRAGRASGCEIGALQSSEMAQPLYEDLGFETVTTYHHFGSAD